MMLGVMAGMLFSVVASAGLSMAGSVVATTVGGPFGVGEAQIVATSGHRIEVEVTVEGPSGAPVVVHAVDPAGDQVTAALVERSPGRHTGRFEVPASDVALVFEDVTSGAQADPVTLTDLGVDPGRLAPPMPPEPGAPADRGDGAAGWGWLALALGLASLSLLAVWTLGGDDPPADERQQPAADA